MSKQYGNAGQGARIMAFKRELIVLGCALCVFFLAWLWMKNAANIATLGLPAVIVLVVLFKLVLSSVEKKAKHVKKRAKDAVRGAAAEVKVAEALGGLPEGFASFHDLSFPGFNIDHVAVGPAGTFVIETKSHRGKVTAEGDKLLLNGSPPEKDFINQAWSQTYQLREYLKRNTGKEYQVKPILCFTSAFVQIRQAVKGVTVINAKFLNELLSRQSQTLQADEVESIGAIMRKQWN